MTVSQKDAAHLNALAEMAAKGHVFHAGDVERDDTDHAAQLFQAYQRGKQDGLNQAKRAIQSLQGGE